MSESSDAAGDVRERAAALALPAGLTDAGAAFPTVFLDAGGRDLRRLSPRAQEQLDHALLEALARVHEGPVEGRALLKVHVGEPQCVTRMRPEHVAASARFVRERGASRTVAGDTTVAYTGPRGHRENPQVDARTYLELARRHGWSADGPATVPFVVLDRPASGRNAGFPFAEGQMRRKLHGIQRFQDVFPAGGFDAAGFVVNHAHLTLHGLAGIACCVKSIAMGCSALPGKLRMHQSLLPHFDEERCVLCGRCVDACPEGALSLPPDATSPVLDEQKCIGCGECVSVCATSSRAASLRGEAIHDWTRGAATLCERMADYTVGLMQGKWATTVHVAHLYAATPLCDCVDAAQEPLLEGDIGFLVGKNPFAVDRLAGRLLRRALVEGGREVEEGPLGTAERTANYVQQAYGILAETPLERLPVW